MLSNMYRLTFRFMHEESVIQIDRLAVKMLFFCLLG